MTDKNLTQGSVETFDAVAYSDTNNHAPKAPQITDVYDTLGRFEDVFYGGTIDDQHPSVYGKAEPDSIVTLYNGKEFLGTVRADANGEWSLLSAQMPELADGVYHLVAIDADGLASEPFLFAVDTSGYAPVIQTVWQDVAHQGDVGQGGSTDDAQPNLRGTAKPTDVVTIYDGDLSHPIGTAQVDALGHWNFTPTTLLSQGAHNLIVATSDGVASAPYAVTIEPIVVPVIESANNYMGSGPELGDGAISDDSRPTLSGSAAPGSLITIYDGDLNHPLGVAYADAQGHWTFTQQIALSEGVHSFMVATPGSEASAPFVIDIEPVIVSPPSLEPAPVITMASDAAGTQTGVIHSGDTTDDAHAMLQGTAAPNSTVLIYDGGVNIGGVMADSNGNWSFTPYYALSDGMHDLTAATTNGVASVPFLIDIETAMFVPPAVEPAPVITAATDEAGVIHSGDTTDDTHAMLQGTATPNSTVLIYDGGVNIGGVMADSNGNWSFAPYYALNDGVHNLTATTMNGVTSMPFVIDVETTVVTPPALDSAPAITAAYDAEGEKIGIIHSGDTTDDAHAMLQGTAAPNSTVMIYDGDLNHQIGAVMTDSNGNWSFTPHCPLVDGVHNLIAATTEGAASTPFVITVDAPVTLPPPPLPTPVLIIDGITQDVGNWHGVLPGGSHTEDTTPTLTGTGIANSIITVSDGNHVLGTTTANAFGQWQYTVETPLNPGKHAFTADDGTNHTVGSLSIIVDAVVPFIDHANERFTQSFDDVASGGILHVGDAVLRGYAQAGSLVNIMDGDDIVGGARANTDGEWTCILKLGEGTHNLVASSAQGTSNSFVLNVDTHVVDTQTQSLALNDVLHGGETELFAAGSSHDDARLSVHDVESNTGVVNPLAVHSPIVPMQELASSATHLVLPHEQAHAHGVM